MYLFKDIFVVKVVNGFFGCNHLELVGDVLLYHYSHYCQAIWNKNAIYLGDKYINRITLTTMAQTKPDSIYTGNDGVTTDAVPTNSNAPIVVPGGYKTIYNLNQDQIQNPDLIYPGQVLTLPEGASYTVVKGDNLTKIAAGAGKGTYESTPAQVTPTDTRGPGIQDTNVTASSSSETAKVDQARNTNIASQTTIAKDWRVRLSLAPNSKYFYKSDTPGILAPLKTTNGVVFPYSPTIQMEYSAAYDPVDVTHSNYKIYNYKNSSVGNITIQADFTAQDVTEANYVMAVLHFFRSATKMFYGLDQNPVRGTPPPLLYLSGYGKYNFNEHPLAITNFSFTYPNDVDYISASLTTNDSGQPIYSGTIGALLPNQTAAVGSKNPFAQFKTSVQRLFAANLNPGAIPPAPVFASTAQNVNNDTRIPTKLSITLTCIPIVTRDTISNQFSLRKYSQGSLLDGSQRPGGSGGIW